MQCCHCQGIESLFSEKAARRELRSYRRKGPTKSTRALLAALESAGVQGRSLLDIGMTTFAVGGELRTTVKLAEPPDSVVIPASGATMIVALSLSKFVPVTSDGTNPS